MRQKQLKLTVVGDQAVGKTSLLRTYAEGRFPAGEYRSTVFPFLCDEEYVYSKSVSYGGRPVLLALWDRVHSRCEDERMRSLQYQQTDVFLLCFSVVDRGSLASAAALWSAETRRHRPGAPCLLVGLKRDLRCARAFSRDAVVTRSMGRAAAERIGAAAYAECSAKRAHGLREVFASAVQTAMQPPPPRPRGERAAPDLCGARLRRFIRLL